MANTNPEISGHCHCGAVRFAVRLSDGLNTARRCNCSYCRMRGAVILAAPAEALRILEGEDMLSAYRFNSGVAQHFFCSRCGIHTHLQRRSDTSLLGINAACLDGLSPFDFAEVPVADGINHPKDTGGPSRQAGLLRFIASLD